MLTTHSKGVSFWICTALIVANMIGTGVFTGIGFQLEVIDSPAQILLLWGLGGLLALCGALSYAELALALPRSGGEYHFLSRIYHPAAGFVAGLISTTVGFVAPTALAALAFAHYLAAIIPAVPIREAAAGVVLIATLPHAWTLNIGGRFQLFFTLLKIALILIFIGAGLWFAKAQSVTFAPTLVDFSAITSAPFAISLIYVMYSYSGWNAVVYILGEVRDVRRTILPALLCGTLFVAVLYVLLNMVFLRTAPMESMKGQLEAGEIASRFIFGKKGGAIMSGLICLGLISSISAMMWTGPRVLQTMGEDIAVLRWFSRKNKNGIPLQALGLQFTLVILLVVWGNFEPLLNYTQFTLFLCTFLTILGVIVLRWKEPALPRPYRCCLYPAPPLIYLAIIGTTLVHLIQTRRDESIAGLSTIAIGLLLYSITVRKKTSVLRQ